MRNLRLYSTEAAFQSYEESKGGDGVTTQTIVPGVSMSLTPRKRYFNPNDKTILVHTVTINYKDDGGQSIAESGTKRFKYISGVSQEVVLTPKNISDYIPTETSKKVNIPQTNSVDFVYEKDYQKFPLTFKIISAGTVYWKMYYYSNSYKRTIQYRKNGGTWTSITSHTGSSAPSISVVSGDILEFIGDNETYCPANGYHSYFSASTTTKFSVEGNIMSLINSTNFEDATTLVSSSTFNNLFSRCYGLTSAIKLTLPAKTLSTGCYSYMFNMCSGLTSAPGLPATTLSVSACTCMFRGCTSLETAPELPATRLADYCYSHMFSGCTSLTTAPELPATTLAQTCYGCMFAYCTNLTAAPALPATTLADYCYHFMFEGCTNLTTAPSILPATTLASSCYGSMFYGCTSLTTAPALPATTLTSSCYLGMFQGCTSLTSAPELPATTLTNHCYEYMFQGCASLNYIKCLATNISATNCTSNWLKSVSYSGRFVKNPSMSSWPSGVSGIPSGWAVEDATL